ncbi:MAG: class I SAM-dependent methyltransferase [Bacteroidota bacterium]
MKLYLKTKDYSFSNQEFELVLDESKDMLVTQPVPNNLEEFYQGENYISHTDSKKSMVDALYQGIKERNIKNKIQLVDNQKVKSRKLLDIGAGTGDFLSLAKSEGYVVEGVEPSPKAREKAKEKGVELKKDLNEVAEVDYDVITLWHVLEHLPNLKVQIKTISNILKDDGVLIIAVPNFRSWDAKHYGKFWAGYDVPRHLWHFSQMAIHKLFKEENMKVKETKPMWFDAFYVSLLSEKYKGNRLYLFSAFFKGLWSNLHAVFTKEHSSLIYILEKDQN